MSEREDTPEPSDATDPSGDGQHVSEQTEQDILDGPHYTEIPARCPECPEGRGNLQVTDGNIFGPTTFGVDVECKTCGFDGNVITAAVDIENKNDRNASAVKNGDLEPIYRPY